MAEILVTSATVKSKAQELQNLTEQFKAKVGELENQEASLNNMWQGQANDAFHNAFQRDKAQMTNFASLMMQYVQTLYNIASEYEKAEAMNTNTGNNRTY